VLGVARIATEKVIPALQRSERCEVVGIASRDAARAREAAARLGIPRAYGSYDALLDDPDIEAVYNPLPNHLHVPWSIRAAERGKHVLCEKPIALSVEEALQLVEARDRTHVRIQEAFMVRTHPQWRAAAAMAASDRIGDVRSIMGYFSYFNDDAANIRNVPEFGGGGLMDIGCYLINTSRYIFRAEPDRVAAAIDRDPSLGVDRLTSLLLDFGSRHAIGTCSTQVVPYQRVNVFGTRGRIEIEIPFNAPPDRRCRVFVDDGRDPFGGGLELLEFETCDQYSIQGDLFSQAIREPTDGLAPLEDAVRNMSVIEAAFRAAESGRWEQPRQVV
jgi:predicted dehydrogenase